MQYGKVTGSTATACTRWDPKPLFDEMHQCHSLALLQELSSSPCRPAGPHRAHGCLSRKRCPAWPEQMPPAQQHTNPFLPTEHLHVEDLVHILNFDTYERSCCYACNVYGRWQDHSCRSKGMQQDDCTNIRQQFCIAVDDASRSHYPHDMQGQAGMQHVITCACSPARWPPWPWCVTCAAPRHASSSAMTGHPLFPESQSCPPLRHSTARHCIGAFRLEATGATPGLEHVAGEVAAL